MDWNAFKLQEHKVPVYVYHIIGWLIYFYEDFFELFTEVQSLNSVVLIFSGQLVIMAIFYIFFFLIWPRTFQPGRYLWAIPGLIIGIIGFILIRYFIQEIILEVAFGFSNYNDQLSFGYYVRDNIQRPLKTIFLSGVIYLLRDQWQKDQRNQKLEQAKREAELALLRSQINPHFLFNMLSYLHAEAYRVDKNLANSVLQLSGLLRYSTQNSLENKTRLRQEIEHLRDYLGLMQKRFGEKCYLDFEVTGLIGEQRVEPLLFLPFVENAFKHGVYTNPETPIQIQLNVVSDRLHFLCKNRINQYQKDTGSGVGIQNVEKRLQLMYPDRYQLQTKEANDWYVVDLVLNIV